MSSTSSSDSARNESSFAGVFIGTSESTSDSTSEATSSDNLTGGGGLAESGLEIDASGELRVVSVVVVDEVDFGLGGVGGNLNDFLSAGSFAFAEEVHKGLLLGRGHDNGAGSGNGGWGTHEDVVVVELGAWEGWGGSVSHLLGGGVVEVKVSGDDGLDAAAISLPDEASVTGGAVGGLGGLVATIGVGDSHSGEKDNGLKQNT